MSPVNRIVLWQTPKGSLPLADEEDIYQPELNFCKIHFNIILPSTSNCAPQVSFFLQLSDYNFVWHLLGTGNLFSYCELYS
jgi:hypothetical protein